MNVWPVAHSSDGNEILKLHQEKTLLLRQVINGYQQRSYLPLSLSKSFVSRRRKDNACSGDKRKFTAEVWNVEDLTIDISRPV